MGLNATLFLSDLSLLSKPLAAECISSKSVVKTYDDLDKSTSVRGEYSVFGVFFRVLLWKCVWQCVKTPR